MAKTDFESVDAYIASQPEAGQKVLKRVRNIIRRAVPGAEEVISYQIPTYKVDGRTVVFFAGWKEHYSIYPATEKLVARLGTELAPYEVQKGTIRFPISGPVPAHLIGRIARLRAEEAAETRVIRPSSATGRRAAPRRTPAKERAKPRASRGTTKRPRAATRRAGAKRR